MFAELAGRKVLLLQGPVGPFFGRLAEELRGQGAEVTQVAFNAGDVVFALGRPYLFDRGTLADWPRRLSRIIDERAIEVLVLFGDRRPLHLAAKEVARARALPVYVFEEGYLRPDYITVELGGVNGDSPMSRDPDFYRTARRAPRADIAKVGSTFARFACFSAINALAHSLCWWCYPRYRHHRSLNVLTEGARWLRSWLRKHRHRLRERGMLERLEGPLAGRFFLGVLQVSLDSQLEYTKYGDVTEFIEEVVESFARSAPADVVLVLKHHPLDRAYRDYTRLIADLARRHGLGERLLYIHDLPLPNLLRRCRGAVMMNSTVGLSALHHGTPVKLTGRACYDLPGLVFQGSLDAFWKEPGEVDRELFNALVGWLQHQNQPNGSFYKRLPGVATPTGVRWIARR